MTPQHDPHAVYNLHALLAWQMAIELADAVGVSAENWQHQLTQLQKATRTAFWADNRWWDDVERTTYSQLAAAMALLSNSVEADQQTALLNALVARSLDPSDEHQTGQVVLASPFMHHDIFEALAKFGRNQAISNIIKLRWGRWADQGEPTTWENWNIDLPGGSACHVFSAHPRYHLARDRDKRQRIMNRIGFLLQVKEEMIGYYKREHEAVWPELLAALTRTG